MKKDAHSLHDHVRLEAFLLSEKAGHPTGMDESFWAQAEAIVHGRTAVVVAPGKPSKAKATKKAVAAVKSKVLPKAEKPAKSAKPKAKK